ncbi:MAG: hypothetical protein INF81_06740 [Roseomonas sp.]|nr:hypothetical protein [Roseomonas sp.]MCA3429145.1 hypothetical protein [Roseomonas sp.]MCA3434746.1 hypothetical protein [Roseomonas sp.]
MDIEQNKQSREALKSYFVPNAIPTAQQFALLIDSMLNQRSDGLVKPAAGPLSIQATGAPTGLRPVLNLYENLSDADPSFSLALGPGVNNTRPALTVLGAPNAALLSIDRASGNVGIGTTDPKAKLEVTGNAVISGNIGVGTPTPRAKLEVVGGAIMPAEGNAATAGIAFPPGASADQAYIRWYARSGEHTTLEIGNSNDSEDHISLMSSGNVGIGTREPRAKLEIAGNIRVGDLAMGPWPGNPAYAFLGSAQQNQMDGGNYGLLFGVTADVGTTFLNGSTQIAFRIRNADQMRLTSEGNFGIGTVTPRAKLEVVGPARIGDLAMGPWPPNTTGYVFLGSALQDQAQDGNYGLLFGTNNDVGTTVLNGSSSIAFRIRNGDQMRLTSQGNFGIGTTAPRAKLEVFGGAIMPAAGDGEAAGILFPPDAFGGGGDRAWIRWLRRGASGERTTLEIGVANDADDHIALMPSGNVGIGTREPAAKLHVKGALLADNIFSGGGFRVGVGQSNSDWVDEPVATGNMGISISVKTDDAGFTEAPFYFTSLAGNSSHWAIIGTTSIYEPTKNGFKVFLRWRHDTRLTAAEARSIGLKINWLGVQIGQRFTLVPRGVLPTDNRLTDNSLTLPGD